MAEIPRPPKAGMHGPGGDPAARPKADAPGEVLEKLEALLGRLHGPDSPGEHPPARQEIPTLNESVHLAVRATGLHATPTGGDIPTLTEPVELDDAKPPASLAMAPLQPAVPAPLVTVVPPAQDSTTLEELRKRVEAMLPHDLEHRLHERAMASLERTLIDIERGFRDELASWREEQTVQIRVEVRAEVERAVDEVLAELARQRRPGAR